MKTNGKKKNKKNNPRGTTTYTNGDTREERG